MMINFLFIGAGMLSLVIAGFLQSPVVGFLVLGICTISFGLLVDLDRL